MVAQQQRLARPLPVVLTILALITAHDASAVVSSSVGVSPVVEAYAKQPSYLHRSRWNRSENDHLRSLFGVACKLRCGGGDVRNDVSGSSTLYMTSDGTTVVKKNNAKYHLIWSPKFLQRMAVSMAVWLILQYTLRSKSLNLERILLSPQLHSCHGEAATTLSGIQRIVPAVVLPLLSSSCCAIQLVINALSGWGCAGFNKYLGPVRPLLLPLLLLSTWKLLPQRSIGWTVLSLLLAFLPELVDIWNAYRSQQWQTSGISYSSTIQSNLITAKLRLNCPTMGCVACVNKVDTSIRQCKSADNIREETSWLTETSEKGGMAVLTILGRTSEEIVTITKEVMGAIERAGFKCKVDSLEVAAA